MWRKLLQITLFIFVFAFFVFAQNSPSEVSINVTVTDVKGQFVNGLTADNFNLYENGKKLNIKNVTVNNSSLAVGFLVDISSSMTTNFNSWAKFNRVDWGRQAILDFLVLSAENNTYFFSVFGEKTKPFQEFPSKDEIIKVIKDDSNFVSPKNTQTGFNDSVALAVEQLSKSKNDRKILIILSDGQDNKSLRQFNDLHNLVRENKVSIISISIYDPTLPFAGKSNLDATAQNYIKKLTNDSGGQMFYSFSLEKTREIAKIIADEMKSQYQITFVPTISGKENKWQKLEVKALVTKEKSKQIGRIFISHRKGYFTISEFLPTN